MLSQRKAHLALSRRLDVLAHSFAVEVVAYCAIRQRLEHVARDCSKRAVPLTPFGIVLPDDAADLAMPLRRRPHQDIPRHSQTEPEVNAGPRHHKDRFWSGTFGLDSNVRSKRW